MMNTFPLNHQKGVTLIEALVAIVIFSIGVLALAGLYGTAIKQAADSKLRGEAAYLANQIISQMWVDRSNLDDYKLNDTQAISTSGQCNAFSLTTATSSNVAAWMGTGSDKGTVLGALPSAKAQIIPLRSGSSYLVTVTLCWTAPQETETHRFTSTALISG